MRRADGPFEVGSEFAAALHEIVIRLEAKKETGRQAEIAGQPQVRVGGDRALAEHDFVDAAGRHIQRAGERSLAHVERPQELLKQDFAWSWIGKPLRVSGNRRLRHRSGLLPVLFAARLVALTLPADFSPPGGFAKPRINRRAHSGVRSTNYM